MTVEFATGEAVVEAEEGTGFDPTRIPRAVEAAGFGPGEIRLRARGTLTRYQDLHALELPGTPPLLVLAGGGRIDDLEQAGLAPGTPLEIQGKLHPSHADQPPGMEVEQWQRLDAESVEPDRR